jgi:hypothetical protein
MSTGKMTPEQFDVHINTEDAHWWFVGRRSVVRSVLSAVIPAGEPGAEIQRPSSFKEIS